MSSGLVADDLSGLDPGGADGLVVRGFGVSHEPRCRPGERLSDLYERQCDRLRRDGHGDRPAVDAGDVALTYDQLDVRANRLARYLAARGVRPGDRVALLFDQAVHAYTGMLAVMKINAAYVPLDAGFPADRLAYITADAGARLVLTLSHLRDRLAEDGAELLCVDEQADAIEALAGYRLADRERGEPVDELAYIIYTSGSTGRPKGVAVEHRSICNFVQVAAECYGVRPDDRMYQGMTIAFDFSVEEIWVPWLVGATLVPKPGGASLLGQDLWDFLDARDVTAVCCVPTLLATLDADLPRLRFLLVSGEACPQDLVTRWHRPDRRFLNVYGPTEATVTATWTEVHPDKPITLGLPLPTYTAVILDPDAPRALPAGALGEIGIAGIGLAAGYVNRDDLTERAFVPDFLALDHNPSGRIYRTGDLGRVNADGEIEYHGRIDTQVKVRGYRIELTEIESVLLQVPGIAAAVVATHEPEPGAVELVGYYSLRADTPELDRKLVYARLRDRLPGYMIPAYLEQLAAIPLLPSDKADRKSLPPPSGDRSLTGSQTTTEPVGPVERGLAELLAATVRLDRIGVDSHFFDELGADSLLMAKFCAKVRARADLPPVSMRDVYLHPTIRALAAAAGPAPADVPAGEPVARPVPARRAHRAATVRYVLTGVAQVALMIAGACLGALLLVLGYLYTSAATGWVELYLRCAAFTAAAFAVGCALPIGLKWLVIGRWKAREVPVWSLGYLRFWLGRMAVRGNPLALFAGTPLYNVYLRLLGAKIGPGAVVLSGTVPVCTDLLTVGAGAVVRKDVQFAGYRAYAGLIQTGPVAIGAGAIIGEMAVLDIDTRVGDGARLGHASSLHAAQEVPAGQYWQGSPAQRAGGDLATVPPMPIGPVRKTVYCVLKLANLLLLTGPLAWGFLVVLLTRLPVLTRMLGAADLTVTRGYFFRDVAIITAILYVGGLLLGLGMIMTVPRLMNLALRPGRVYRLYGIHHWLQVAIGRWTNNAYLMQLFGDSSYVVHYLRWLGYDLGRVVQTGSNFGNELKHDTPFLCSVGSGTMVSDGLSLINSDVSATSFRLSRTFVPPRSFLGNNLAYPPQATVGDDCLFGTKTAVPVTGPAVTGTGLLGSPSFEIPRAVAREAGDRPAGDELRRRLRAKNRYNLGTIGVYLLVGYGYGYGAFVLTLTALDLLSDWGLWVLPAAGVLGLVYHTAYTVLVERAVGGFRPLRPRRCSIYDPYYWWHERLWKVEAGVLFTGTPFRGPIMRALGVRVGRRLFDDGCYMPEKTLVTIGDDATLNATSVIQCHSQEDGFFRSEHTELGSGCTLGVGAFVHYGVRIGEGGVLGPHSFLMKGEQLPAGQVWDGNPARQLRVELPEPVLEGEIVAGTAAEAATEAVVEGEVVDEVVPEPVAVVPEPAGPRSGSRAAARQLLAELRATPAQRRGQSTGLALSLFRLQECHRRQDELAQFLGADERAEAATLRSGERRSAYVVTRALIRMILSIEWHGEVAPRDWVLGRSGFGKLAVFGPVAGIDLSFAQTPTLLAIAVSESYDIGVDLGTAERGPDALPWPLLSADEQTRLVQTDARQRGEHFLRMWTLKAAYARCAGTADLERLDTRLDPLDVLAPGAGEARCWFHQEQWCADEQQHWLTVAVRPRDRRADRRAARPARPAVSKSVGRSGRRPKAARPRPEGEEVLLHILADGAVEARSVEPVRRD
ncbi:amino acid adenylation domain-containing protein [Catellatospora sp. KI3]|uniref:Pls/PosA family non-ribosomal peptide synthetase n=1 Tax=Catellatospora sp. KI3 TaxID=3041620 RepID=UPI0024829598|nr:Pls/PosA family non-ribosomal peptide synthetase [Catellatospora sp. KI3]MDI1464931.1 amino acid adenylation domain-containing protein [Catellatospora sp. KI3]